MVTPEQLRRIADEKDMEKAREALEKKRKAEDEQHQVRDAFVARDIHPDVYERVSKVVRASAERGEREVLVLASRAPGAPTAAGRSTTSSPAGRTR
jgi:hypothetical protein